MTTKKLLLSALTTGALISWGAQMPKSSASFWHANATPLVEMAAVSADQGARQQNEVKSKKIPALLKEHKGKNEAEKAKGIYETFAVKYGGLKLSDSSYNKRPPRQIDETIEKGGDCSEFAMVLAEASTYLNLDGGAYIIHMENAGEDEKHVVVYVNVKNEKNDEKKIIIDPQADSINKVLDGSRYEILADLSFAELGYLYYREYGDYHYNKTQYEKAARDYGRALKLYDADPYIYHGLSISLQRNGRLKEARKYSEKLLELSFSRLYPKSQAKKKKYASTAYRIIVESVVEEGTKKCVAGKSSEGREMLEKALGIGLERKIIDKNEESVIRNNMEVCSGE